MKATRKNKTQSHLSLLSHRFGTYRYEDPCLGKELSAVCERCRSFFVVEFFHFFGRSAMICILLGVSISFADEVRKDFLLHKQKMESISEDRESGLKAYLEAKNKAKTEAEANRQEFLKSKKATRNQLLIDREKTAEYYQDQKAKKEYDQSIKDSVKEHQKNKLQQNANMAPIGHDAKTEAVEYGLVPPAERIDLKKRQLYSNKKLTGPSGGMGGSGSYGGSSFGGASGGGYSGGGSGSSNYSPPPPPPVPEYFDSGSDFPPPPPPSFDDSFDDVPPPPPPMFDE